MNVIDVLLARTLRQTDLEIRKSGVVFETNIVICLVIKFCFIGDNRFLLKSQVFGIENFFLVVPSSSLYM